MTNGPELWAAILGVMPPGSIIAGGAVRDYLLGVEPKDIDVFFDIINWTHVDGFEPLGGNERTEEYEAMGPVCSVNRGRLFDYQIDMIGMELFPFDGPNLVETFDFGITRCWFDGEVRCLPECQTDFENRTVTLLIQDRPERAAERFLRFNQRHLGVFELVTT
ncbi:MAG: hypothetical protein ACK4FG_01815 [Brevundimonas sp.]